MGTPAFGVAPRGTFPFPFWLPEYAKPFELDVHTRDGAMIRRCVGVTGAQEDYRLNEPPELRFSVALSNAEFLHPMNEVWVRDAQQTIVGKYIIAEREETDSETQAVSLTCLGYLWQLSQEWALEIAEADCAVGDLLSSLLALQVQDTPITLGSVDSGVSTATVRIGVVRPVTLLALLNEIERQLPTPTTFWVDSDRQLNWSANLYSGTNDDLLMIGRNAAGVVRVVSGEQHITRLYVYGANNARLSDAEGQDEDYVQSDLAEYQYRKMLTIDHNDIPPQGTTNYALSVVEASDADLAAHAASDGSDIVFIASDEKTELTSVLNSYNSTTGAINATVTVPFASGVVDTILYMYFGIGA